MANLFKVTYESGPVGVPAGSVTTDDWVATELPQMPEAEAVSAFNRLRAVARVGGGVRAVKIFESNIPVPVWTDVTAAYIPVP